MLRAAILDVDGTLVDTNYHHVEAWARAFHQVGLRVPRAAIHHQIGKGSDQLLPMWIQDPALAERADRLHTEIYDELKVHAYALPGAPELLAALVEHGVQAWFATSAKPEELERNIEVLSARDKLAGIISSGDVDRSKPAPDIFRASLEHAHVPPEDAVVLGDTVWDMIAARASGVRAIGLLTGGAFTVEELRQAGAVAVFDDCAALLGSGFPRGF